MNPVLSRSLPLDHLGSSTGSFENPVKVQYSLLDLRDPTCKLVALTSSRAIAPVIVVPSLRPGPLVSINQIHWVYIQENSNYVRMSISISSHPCTYEIHVFLYILVMIFYMNKKKNKKKKSHRRPSSTAGLVSGRSIS